MKTQHQLLRTVNRELEEDFKLTAEVGQTVQVFQHISEGMKQVRLNTTVGQKNTQMQMSNISTFSSKLAARMCRKVNQNVWSKHHGKEVAEPASDLKSLADAVYELTQSTSPAHIESRKLVLTVLGLGISLPPSLLLRSLSTYLQRDVTTSHISPKEWRQYVLDETTVSIFIDKQQRRKGRVVTQPSDNRDSFSEAVQVFLAHFEAILKDIRSWWYQANRRGAGTGVSRAAQSLTEIGCFSNPGEALIHIQKLLGTRVTIAEEDYLLFFVRGLIKSSISTLTRVLGGWKDSGMPLAFQLSMLKKSLLLSGLRYRRALVDPSQQVESVVNRLDEAQQELYSTARPSYPPPVTRRPVSLPRGVTKHTHSSSASVSKPEDHYQQIYSRTLQEMEDVVSYIPDVNLFLVLSDSNND